MIRGQEKICERIDKSTLDSFPRTLMIVGPRGGGKHLICSYIAEKFNLMQRDITEELSQETIDEISTRVEPYLYIINANALNVKEENVILKFLEEPLKNSFIVLVAETDIGILQTVINRCQIWYLQNYNREFLSTFITNGNNDVLQIAETPGQVVELMNINFDEAVQLADKIVDKINIASVSNTLTLSNKVSYKESEENKVNIQLFVDILISRIHMKWSAIQNSIYVPMYSLTAELKRNLTIKNLDQKYLFENYLISLWSLVRRSS